MTSVAAPNAKVLFRVTEPDGSANVETLWAYDLGGDRYRLDNSPFYAYGVSAEDTVLAPRDDVEGIPTFRSVVSKSGNRTVRIIFDPPVASGNESDSVLQGLIALGCDFEGANPRYVVVNVPPRVDLVAVVSYLVGREANWEHADPTYDEFHANDA
jgi:Domain of unknown function (DUF4265)